MNKHRRWMEVYWCWAQSWWEDAEYFTLLYPTELAQYELNHPRPNLKDYMIQTKGQPR